MQFIDLTSNKLGTNLTYAKQLFIFLIERLNGTIKRKLKQFLNRRKKEVIFYEV